MPNIKSAIKELRKGARKHARNKKVLDNLKVSIKKTKKAILAKDAKAKEILKGTLKALDKAAQKGIIKKNTRDRKKSRLQHKLNFSLKTK